MEDTEKIAFFQCFIDFYGPISNLEVLVLSKHLSQMPRLFHSFNTCFWCYNNPYIMEMLSGIPTTPDLSAGIKVRLNSVNLKPEHLIQVLYSHLNKAT